jgi:hypothetical protein
MARYAVEVLRTVATTVEVEAEDPDEAHRKVNDRSFPLPPIQEWEPLDGWEYVVYDEAEQEVLRID